MVRRATDLTVNQLRCLTYYASLGKPVLLIETPHSLCAATTLKTLAARGFIKVTIEALPKGIKRIGAKR